MKTQIEIKIRKQSPSRISEVQHKLIMELKDQGMQNLTVAKKVGVSSVTVRTIYNTQRGFVGKPRPYNYSRTGENTLTAVEDLDFANGEYFCPNKWAAIF